jgi:hypothetical protein
LEDCFIVESGGAQSVVVAFLNFGGVLGNFDYVSQHLAFLVGYWCGGEIIFQGFDKRFVKRYPTQKLCV